VSIIDKVINPTWYAISILPEDQKLEVARLVIFVGGWRWTVEKFFVNDLLDEIRSTYGRTASSAEANRLVTHASLAILRCSGPLRGFDKSEFKYISLHSLKMIVELILSIELQTEGEEEIAPYAEDGETAKIQFFWSALDYSTLRQSISHNGWQLVPLEINGGPQLKWA
jgi:hypothetical protein